MKVSHAIALSVVLANSNVAAANLKNTFPAGSTPGRYEDLRWVNITALKQGTGFTGLMIPASGEYYGSITNKSDPTTNYATPPGVIAAQYPGSKVKSFSLKSFYWGCLVETKEFQGSPRPFIFTAENCTVTVSGYKKTAKSGVYPVSGATPDATASFNYVPKDDNSPNEARHMNKFTLPGSFNNVKLVQFNWVATAVNYYDNATNTFYQFSNGASLGLIDDVVFSTTSA